MYMFYGNELYSINFNRVSKQFPSFNCLLFPCSYQQFNKLSVSGCWSHTLTLYMKQTVIEEHVLIKIRTWTFDWSRMTIIYVHVIFFVNFFYLSFYIKKKNRQRMKSVNARRCSTVCLRFLDACVVHENHKKAHWSVDCSGRTSGMASDVLVKGAEWTERKRGSY